MFFQGFELKSCFNGDKNERNDKKERKIVCFSAEN